VKTARNASYDFLRTTAAFAVVVVHVSTGVIFFEPGLDQPHWWLGNFFDASVRWCVPIFIMLSGALQIPKSRRFSSGAFIKSRLTRILWPSIFWSAFYIGFSIWMNHYQEIGFALAAMGGKPFFHLWYFYLSIGLYLATPIIRIIYDRVSNTALASFVVASFVISTIITAPQIGGGFISILSGFAFLSYYVLGAAIVEKRFVFQLPNFLLIAVLILSWLSLATGAALLMPSYGAAGWEYMFSFSHVVVALMAISIFLLCHHQVQFAASSAIGPYTLGIYAIHPLWILALEHVGISGFSFGAWLGIPLTALIVFLLSIASTRLLCQVPALRLVLQ
jgi:surface polysaccharide O-acyltransferase-like enzyme